MTELHDAYVRWLVAGHRDAVPRDVGLHAAGCAECAVASDAFDALERIDPAAAPEPALVPVPVEPRRRVAARWIAATATLVAAIAVGGFVAANLPSATSGTAQAGETESHAPIAVGTPGGGVLAGGPETDGSPTPTATPDASDSADSPEASASTSPGQAAVLPPWHPEPTPSFRGNPTPTGSPGASRTAAPSPTPISTANPTPVPPTPTLTPTPVPTPEPTPTPVPTPEPTPACSNGLDDDGDGVTDMDDPGCLDPLDDSEVDP